MNNFSYSDLASRLKLHLLETYPPGTYIPMSELPEPEYQRPAKSRIELTPPPSPVKFEQKPMKEKIGAMFPQFGLHTFLLVVKRDEVKECESLLQAIRTKLCSCDLLILEEAKEVPKGYKAVLGTESTLFALRKMGALEGIEIAHPEWALLSKDKKSKLDLWNRLSEIR